jgi:hypothetical protein
MNYTGETCELSAKNYTINQEIQDEELNRLNRNDEFDVIEGL